MFCIRSFQSDNDTLFPFYDDIYSLKRLNVFSVPDKKNDTSILKIVAVWHL